MRAEQVFGLVSAANIASAERRYPAAGTSLRLLNAQSTRWLFDGSIHTSDLQKLPLWVDPFSIMDALRLQGFYVGQNYGRLVWNRPGAR